MAKGKEDSSGKGRVKFRFIEFELDGSDQTLQKAISELTQAVGRPQVVIRTPPAVALPAAVSNGNETLAVIDGLDSAETAQSESADQDEPNGNENGSGEDRPRKPRRFKSPKIVAIDLRGSEKPLKDFFSQLTFETDAQRYTLIAFWFKTYRGVPNVTPDHIYTAYKELGWTNLPKDVGAPLRALKAQGWFEKADGELAYSINHIGEGKAEDLIARSSQKPET